MCVYDKKKKTIKKKRICRPLSLSLCGCVCIFVYLSFGHFSNNFVGIKSLKKKQKQNKLANHIVKKERGKDSRKTLEKKINNKVFMQTS